MEADSGKTGKRMPRVVEGLRASLAFRCVVVMVVYAAALIGLFAFVNMTVDKRLNQAFPTMDTVTEQESALEHDRFGELAQALPKTCDLVVFSGSGERLYASSSEAAEKITAADLPVINGTEDERRFYEVLEWEDDEGGPLTGIFLCAADGDSMAKIVKKSCVCDEDGVIVEGDLFEGREALTEHELSLIKGMYGARKTIQKHEYETVDGEKRTVVLIAPVVSDATYDAVAAQAGQTWLLAIPIALAATVVAVAVLAFMVRRMMRPLDQAIDARRNVGGTGEEPGPLPIELRPTYDNFVDLMDQLDVAQSDKQRIIADVSHDLKTPLTVISGYTQAFEDGRVPEEKREEYLHAINERAQAATRLIDSLFAYAKSEHPSFAANPAPCDLYEQVRLLLARRQPDVEHVGDVLEADIPEGSLVMQLDWGLLERAIDNLVNNACKHNPAGTVIRVSCDCDGAVAAIAVADTGSGVSDELRETAFEPFVTSNSARAVGQGTGLGLAIVSSCARLHGGFARFAEPKAPFVTEIVIEIPVARR